MIFPLPRVIRYLLTFLLSCSICQVTGQERYETQADLPAHIKPTLSPPLSPQEALNSFELVEGFKIELVASEPMIEDPIIIDWDTEGRLWVAEMRGFMTDINATGQFEKIGRISVLEDTDADGKMDKVTRFLDDLVLPRALRCFQDGILVAEHEKLWYVTDTNNDLVPDEKILVDSEYATHGSVEHRPNGLLIGLDNWIYNSRSNKRYSLVDGEWIIDATENRGQWGITQDDYGRLYYNFHWSQLHSDIAPPNTLTRNPNFTPTLSVNATVSNDQLVYPIRMNTAINRGYRSGVLDDEGKLKRFASACSPWIYRGGSFPASFSGNAFVCAPAANTIKRNLITDAGLTVSGTNAYPDRDFVASTDERFRPVSLSGGPDDGALYVVDMYRGIIQQADFMTAFLRKESERRNLEQPINQGRIYRIRSSNGISHRVPDFDYLSPAQWVEQLGHPNGWARDRAQQWLVWKKPVEAIKHLQALTAGSNPRSIIHALWTLDGMGADSFLIAIDLIPHANSKIATAAMAIAARQATTTTRIQELVTTLAAQFSKSQEHAFHSALALGQLGNASETQLLLNIATSFAESPNIREAILSSLAKQELKFLQILLKNPDWANPAHGKQLLLQSLASCALRSEGEKIVRKLLELASGNHWYNLAIREGALISLLERNDPMKLDFNPGIKDARFRSLLQWPGHNPLPESTADFRPLDKDERVLYVQGQAIYAGLCASCHGPDGKGMTMLAPPLIKSEWVTGDPDRLARILLHGLEGPIEVNARKYGPPDILPAMPPVGMMS
ncbi:MAG: c-type cytochrome, partial [Verrucomicrobia bacterium]|nr:c-type cytochrome [Verrucomicrobiota bacterium]